MDIVLCSSREQALWDNYVQSSSTATACHLFAWRTIIERAYGHQALYLMVRKDGAVAGILPLILVKSPLLGTSLTSMPFLDYGGLCADDQTIADLLLDNVVRIQQESGAQWVELRQCEPLKQASVSRVDKVSMVLDLSRGGEFVWKSLPAKVRNQVRKSEKSGLTTCVGGVELLDDFECGVRCPGCEDVASGFQHPLRDARDLSDRLPFAVDHFRHAVAEVPVMVDMRIGDVLEGKVFKALQC